MSSSGGEVYFQYLEVDFFLLYYYFLKNGNRLLKNYIVGEVLDFPTWGSLGLHHPKG